jgi:hypothetical protein
MLLLVVVVVLSSWMALAVQKAGQQKEAIEWLTFKGTGRVETDYHWQVDADWRQVLDPQPSVSPRGTPESLARRVLRSGRARARAR